MVEDCDRPVLGENRSVKGVKRYTEWKIIFPLSLRP